MSFYTHSLAKIAMGLLAKFPESKPEEADLDTFPHRKMDHVYWMAMQVHRWKTTSRKQSNFFVCLLNWFLRPLGMQLYDVALVQQATKAGRWVGWMLRVMEEAKVWNNTESRNITRTSVDLGEDLPQDFLY
jgi:hypothetical protein